MSKKKLRIWFVLIVCTCQAPKVFKDSDSTCDCLSENWQFALAELNSSHYMAVCVEDDSRSSGLYFKIFSLQKNCLYPVLWLIVGACCRFWEWSATSRIESMEDCSLRRRYACFWNRSCDSYQLSMWESAISLMVSPDDNAIQWIHISEKYAGKLWTFFKHWLGDCWDHELVGAREIRFSESRYSD